VIALGGLTDGLANDVEAAIDPAGATISEVAVLRVPPDVEALDDRLEGTRHARVKRPEEIEALGRAVGRQLVLGGGVIRRVRAQLLTRFSGRPSRTDDVVVVREIPGEMSEREEEEASRFESGLLDGITSTPFPVVGAERTDTEESSVELFDSHGIPTVDDIDLVAGRVAMISVLRGAEGNFGVKESADELLPDLLRPGGP
jgi:hypothetical protein